MTRPVDPAGRCPQYAAFNTNYMTTGLLRGLYRYRGTAQDAAASHAVTPDACACYQSYETEPCAITEKAQAGRGVAPGHEPEQEPVVQTKLGAGSGSGSRGEWRRIG